MPLQSRLRDALTRIAEDLLEGSLSQRINYGTFPFRSQLEANGIGGADEVLEFLNEEVGRRTNGTHGVVYADPIYLADAMRMGLFLAYVPVGQDATSPNARYFGIAPSTNGVQIYVRAAAEEVRRRQENLARSARQVVQRWLASCSNACAGCLSCGVPRSSQSSCKILTPLPAWPTQIR
jgi:hypothetical protein